MSAPIVVPPDVRRRAGIPDGPLELASAWAMVDGLRGLWIRLAGQSTGQCWSIINVRVDVAQSWLDAGKRTQQLSLDGPA